jgi:hypothetical protein
VSAILYLRGKDSGHHMAIPLAPGDHNSANAADPERFNPFSGKSTPGSLVMIRLVTDASSSEMAGRRLLMLCMGRESS